MQNVSNHVIFSLQGCSFALHNATSTSLLTIAFGVRNASTRSMVSVATAKNLAANYERFGLVCSVEKLDEISFDVVSQRFVVWSPLNYLLTAFH